MPVIINPDPTLQSNLMAFGYECDKGWYPLIEELIQKLNRLPEEIYVTQVKEKFGGLRFYVASCGEEAYTLIHRYEGYSYHICEICGEFWTAKLRIKNGWYKTTCDKCGNENGYICGE